MHMAFCNALLCTLLPLQLVSSYDFGFQLNSSVLKSKTMRIGSGDTNSINSEGGGLTQPFYLSPARGWTKLTYADYELDFSVRMNGKQVTLANSSIDFVNQSYAEVKTGLQSDDAEAVLKRIYAFVADGVVFKITYSFTASNPIDSVEIWFGTNDDWIGKDDKPTKKQGSFVGGHFAPTVGGKVLSISSGEEEVYMFSPHPDSQTIIATDYGQWDHICAKTESDVDDSSSDGGYAIYIPFGQFDAGDTKSSSVYYAAADAGEIDQLMKASSHEMEEEKTKQTAVLSTSITSGPTTIMTTTTTTTITTKTTTTTTPTTSTSTSTSTMTYTSHSSEVIVTEPMSTTKAANSGTLLVEAYELCMTDPAVRRLDFCKDTLECFSAVSLAETACQIISLPTIGISELNGYVCGDGECAVHARRVRANCSQFTHARSLVDPVLRYADLYCPKGDEATDIINDHSNCRLHLEDSSHLCQSANRCWESMAGIDSSCRLNEASMASLKLSVCSKACQDHVETALDHCTHYNLVKKHVGIVTTYQDRFACGLATASQLESLRDGRPEVGKNDTLLVEAYEECMTGKKDRESEECKDAITCFGDFSIAETSCNFISEPTLGISELTTYVCGKSLCAETALKLNQSCAHFPWARSFVYPIFSYQEKYCPAGEQPVDLINDHYTCRLEHEDRKPGSSFCKAVDSCFERFSEAMRACRLNAASMASVKNSVCSIDCFAGVTDTQIDCINYTSISNITAAIDAYQSHFGCTMEFGLKASLPETLLAMRSTAGLLVVGIFAAALTMLSARSISRLSTGQRDGHLFVEVEAGNDVEGERALLLPPLPPVPYPTAGEIP